MMRWIPALFLATVLAANGCAGTAERAQRDAYERALHADVPSAQADAAASEPSAWTGALDLDSLLAQGVARNRSVRAARERWKAAIERGPTAGKWPDPEVTWGRALRDVGEMERVTDRIEVSQGIPWPGSRGAMRDAAVAMAAMSEAEYHAERARVGADITAVFAELLYLAEAGRLTRETLDLVSGWESVLRMRYASGTATYSDLLKVQVEMGALEDDALTLARMADPARAELRALLDLPPDARIPDPAGFPGPIAFPGRDSLRSAVERRNPRLAAMRARVAAGDEEVGAARSMGKPHFMVGLEWMRMEAGPAMPPDFDPENPIMGMIGVTLPIWRGAEGARVREAEALRASAAEALAAETSMVQSRLDAALFRVDDARRKESLYEDALLPKARQALDASFSAYESGAGGFLDVLDAERMTLTFSLALARARADRLAAEGALLALLGRAERGDTERP